MGGDGAWGGKENGRPKRANWRECEGMGRRERYGKGGGRYMVRGSSVALSERWSEEDKGVGWKREGNA